MIRYRRFRAGLSLVEVVISALLLSILTLVLVGVMQLTLQYWRKTNVHVQAEKNAQAIMQAMCNDFRQCTSATAGEGLNIPAVSPSPSSTVDTGNASFQGTNPQPFLEFTIADPATMNFAYLNTNLLPKYDLIDYYLATVPNPNLNVGGVAYGVFRVDNGDVTTRLTFGVSAGTFTTPVIAGGQVGVVAATETGALEVSVVGLAGGDTGNGSTPPKVHFHVLASEFPNTSVNGGAGALGNAGSVQIQNGAAYTYELDTDQTAYSI